MCGLIPNQNPLSREGPRGLLPDLLHIGNSLIPPSQHLGPGRIPRLPHSTGHLPAVCRAYPGPDPAEAAGATDGALHCAPEGALQPGGVQGSTERRIPGN